MRILPYDPILSTALAGALAVTGSLRDQIVQSMTTSPDLFAFFDSAVRQIFAHEPMLEQILRDGQLAAYLKAGMPVVRKLPAPAAEGPHAIARGPLAPSPATPSYFDPGPGTPTATPRLPPPFRPPPPVPSSSAGDDEPIVRFPLIEKAAEDLAERRIMTPADFQQLDLDAKRQAFTVARVSSLETIEGLRDSVSQAAAQGQTLAEWRKGAREALADGPILSDAHLENVYRTNIASGYSAGQQAILSHPQVASAFPYVLWTATHDSRTRPDHLAMETTGIDGTAVYRRDDPLILLCWPPAGYNCRCHLIPLTIRDAAKRGVREAIEWERTGVPPMRYAWVDSVPLKLPRNWSRGAPAVAA